MYKRLIRPLLFQFPPELIHDTLLWKLKIASLIPGFNSCLESFWADRSPPKPTSIAGLIFKNRVGLAAGFDKNGIAVDALAALGFGFVEVGTVTPRAQEGNPKPRLFRLPKDHALINRMGFNNAGAEALRRNLEKRKTGIPIGVNIGKMKLTPNEKAAEDYAFCFETLHTVADYFVLNISSPNTPDLRELQRPENLKNLLNHIQNLNQRQSKARPLFVKLAPDLSDELLGPIMDVLKNSDIHGVIATNTTITREPLMTDKSVVETIGAGGLSGRPLQARSTQMIRFLRAGLGSNFPIIGCGGVDSPEAAQEKIEAGANLIQIYTGLIYEGPELIRKISRLLGT